MVSVQDVTEMVTTRLSLETVEAEQRQLLSELQITNDRLSEMNKDLQDSNEELQAANEELVLVQEELQATNEEFEATNEELQATNEELETNNEELQSTNEELETTNDELQARTNDLQDLMRSLASERLRLSEMVKLAPYDIVVVRGPFMIVEAFNPGASRFFHGNEVINMPIEDVFRRPEMSQLLEKMNTAFAKDTPQEVRQLAARVLTEQGDEVERTFNFR